MHPCRTIYQYSNKPIYGTTPGICRITGEQSTGIEFNNWVRNTFTDHAYLKPGTIISNEALFCFDEASNFIAEKTNKDKPQRFRNYTHIVANGEWHILTKADKQKIYDLLISTDPEVCVISDSGQRHLVFKHHPGTWQLEDHTRLPDKEKLHLLHSTMCALLQLGFSQTQIIEGNYFMPLIAKDNTILYAWRCNENLLKPHRGTAMFNLAAFLMFNSKKENV